VRGWHPYRIALRVVIGYCWLLQACSLQQAHTGVYLPGEFIWLK
jgi:hypothetical protein